MMLLGVVEVEQILQTKYQIACDRDVLRNLLRHLRERIQKLEDICKRKYSRNLKKQIQRYRTIAGSLIQSIEALNALIESTGNSRIFKFFRSIFSFFVTRVNTLRSYSHMFSDKFRGIYHALGEMISNVSELKKFALA